MIHRHLDYPPETPLAELGPAALDDLLDQGDLDDWAPLARALTQDPYGSLADTVARLCDAHPMYGTSSLWRAFLDRARARAEGALQERAAGRPSRSRVHLADLRRERGVTQVVLAGRLGIAQSDLSKLERRADARLSSLRAYVAGLGGRLALVAQLSGGPRVEVELIVGK